MTAQILSRLLGARRWEQLLQLDYGSRLYACNLVGSVPNFRLRHLVYRRLGRLQLGVDCSLHRGLRMFCLGGVAIGSGSIVNGECWLDGRQGITIGSHVSISIGCKLLTLSHDPQDPNFNTLGAPIVVEDYAWLGAFSMILPGVRVGRGAIVGAGSIVTRDVADWTIVAGNPARVVGQRQSEVDYRLAHAPLFF